MVPASAPTETHAPVTSPDTRSRFYYGWTVLLIAALAMVGTLPGRTQGLGLITEPLLQDLRLGPVEYARLNLWATLIGALFCIGVGQMQDRFGSRFVLAGIAAALGVVVVGMSRTADITMLFVLLTLTRGLGQSALSVVSLTMVGQWFRLGLDRAMAVYSIVMSMGFMIAFPVVGAVVTKSGWRAAWGGIGWSLLLVLTPLALLLVPTFPKPGATNREMVTIQDDKPVEVGGYTLLGALRTPAFWVMAIASALYGLIASGIGLFNESVLKERGFAPETYHMTLAVTALTSLTGNFLGGFLTMRGGMNRLMAVAMFLLMLGLVALPQISTIPQVMTIAVLMGIAGGFVIVLFFAFWGRVYGPAHLGKIQGAAQTITVLASAVGPLILAAWVERTGSYAGVFYLLAVVVALFALASWVVRVPNAPVAATR
jgi:MFS family permease